MLGFLNHLPHCVLYGRPILSGLMLGSNLGIFLAYVLIPLAIERVRRKRGTHFNKLALLFVAFILLCGFGHLIEVIAITQGKPAWAWFRALEDVVTMIVSLFTAYYIFRLIPTIIKFPTIIQWEETLEILENYRQTKRWEVTGKP